MKLTGKLRANYGQVKSSGTNLRTPAKWYIIQGSILTYSTPSFCRQGFHRLDGLFLSLDRVEIVYIALEHGAALIEKLVFVINGPDSVRVEVGKLFFDVQSVLAP